MQDWEINPDNYLKDSEGSFVLKKDGTPRRKGGRPKGSKGKGYNYHSKTKATMQANKSIREKQKKIKKTASKLEAYKKSLENNKKTLKKIEGSEASVTSPEDLEGVPKALKEEAEILFQPNEGPQTDFLAASETDVLYGGAAGGGKS